MATRTASQVKTKTATIDGLSIRYAESVLREVSAILLSPWPESLYTFEQMWSRLAEHAHLVAIDLPGFGHSERNDDLLKSSAMAEFVVRAINEFGLNCPHAVGPDIGASTLLFAAAKHPDLLRSIVLGNGTAAVPIQVGGVLNDVLGAPDLEASQDRSTTRGRFGSRIRRAIQAPRACTGGFPKFLRRRSICRILAFPSCVHNGATQAQHVAAHDQDARTDHYGRPRSRCAAGERRLSA